MSAPTRQPELIITLSRDKVRLQLLSQPDQGRAPWQSAYPILGDFLEDQVSLALDTALTDNPALVDHFDSVEVVVIDRPNICVPRYLSDPSQFAPIASRYLRLRSGDILSTDATPSDAVICYSLPKMALNVLHEYYYNIGHVHMASLLWNSLSTDHPSSSEHSSRLFFNLIGHHLIVLGETNRKLTFSKIFYIRENADLTYYTLACSRMILARENWFVTITDEPVIFDVQSGSHMAIHHRIQLPSLPALVAHHSLCES